MHIALARSALRALDSIEKILGEADDGSRGRLETTNAPPAVRFEKVSFEYGPDSRVLEDVDLDIRPGEVLAIVGVNGAGKSTLVKLLAKLYEPTGGSVLVDGQALADTDT